MTHQNRLIEITDPHRDRYATLRLIDWWVQQKVQNARIMVVGAGALGNEVLKNLALLGVGHLFIVDFDTVEASNLTRSVLFRPEDGGRLKAEVAAERIHALNPDVEVVPFCGDVTHELGLGVYRRMDGVIGCLDNRAARMAVNKACWHLGKAWVDGALDVLDGLVRVFVPPDGACYECTMTDQDYALMNLRYSCPPGFVPTIGRQPTTPMAASTIAAMQVQEAIKLLHGLPVESGVGIYYSGQTLRFTRVAYRRKEECPAHHIYDSIISLPYGVDDLTVEAFINAIQERLKSPGTLFLPRVVVSRFDCPDCGHEEFVYRPYEAVVPECVLCPNCDAPRRFETVGAFTPKSPKQDIPLAQLGIPPLHILPVRTRSGWTYFELSADAPRILNL